MFRGNVLSEVYTEIQVLKNSMDGWIEGWTDMWSYKPSKMVVVEFTGAYIVKFFQLQCMFKIFHNNMLRKMLIFLQ